MEPFWNWGLGTDHNSKPRNKVAFNTNMYVCMYTLFWGLVESLDLDRRQSHGHTAQVPIPTFPFLKLTENRCGNDSALCSHIY